MSKSGRIIVSALFLAAVFSSLSFASSPDRIPGAISGGPMIALAKTLHPLARPEYDQGAVDPAFKLQYMTLLTSPSPAQQKSLNLLLTQQQDPGSANYHKWLTPAQYADRFGLSQQDINRIAQWLTSQGFAVLNVGGGRNTVIFCGTAAQVQSAFGAEIHNYSVNGEKHFANSTPIMVPAALTGIVTGLRGVHDFHMHAANSGRMGARPQSRANFYDGNYIFPNFLAPSDVATIYDFSTLTNGSTTIDGTGQRIAVIGETDIFLADINDFRSGFGLNPINASYCTTGGPDGVITSCDDPQYFKYILVPGQIDPLAPDSLQQGDITEADLDVEWSGAVAQNAQIIYVNAPSTNGNGVGDSLSYALNPPQGTAIPAPVVTMSYGSCERESADDETELAQGVSEGITIINSAGDDGAAACDFNPSNSTRPFSAATGGQAVSYPASSAYVVSVGGTAITLANDSYPSLSSYWSTNNGSTWGNAQGYIPETPWNDGEELLAYCKDPASGDAFCSNGNGTSGWVAITSSSTGQQMQEDIWIAQGGGGASNCFSESLSGICTGGTGRPSWQQSLSITNAPSGVRLVPDVSFLASPNFPGYIFCTPLNPDGSAPDYTSTCSGGIFNAVDNYGSLIGGTSVSAPVFAGIMALMNQYLNGSSTAGLGDVHPVLYKLAKTPSNGAFHQIAGGDNMVYCQPGTPAGQPAGVICPSTGVVGFSSSGSSNVDATTGYNLVTGLGSVKVSQLALAWNALLNPTFTVSPTSSNATVNAGQSASSTVTVTPLAGSTDSVKVTCTGPTGVTCAFTLGSQTNVNPLTFPMDGVTANNVSVSISTLPNMATGAQSVTITATDTTTGSAQTSTVALTVNTTTESFTMGAQNASYQVTPGQSASVVVTIASTTGFVTGTAPNQTTAVPVSYSCSDPASESLCTVSPSTATTGTTVTFTITTTAPTGKMESPFHRSGIFYAALLPGLLGIVLTFSRKRSLGGMRMLGLIVMLGFSTMWLGSCGGSSSSTQSNPGTPANTNPGYTITFNASTGGAHPLTSTTTVILAVQ